jgi:hypothetical protein
VEGLELSPRANGAVVYAVVVGFFSATMGRPLLPVEQPRFELILDKEASQAIDHNQSFGPVVIPERVINEKKVDKEGSSKSK